MPRDGALDRRHGPQSGPRPDGAVGGAGRGSPTIPVPSLAVHDRYKAVCGQLMPWGRCGDADTGRALRDPALSLHCCYVTA
jgi:hypothetical protein